MAKDIKKIEAIEQEISELTEYLKTASCLRTIEIEKQIRDLSIQKIELLIEKK